MMIVRVSSLFLNNPCIERQLLCIVNWNTNKFCSTFLNSLKSKATIQPFEREKIMADNSNKEVTGSQQTRNWQEMRDPMDHIREVPIGATETIRTVCRDVTEDAMQRYCDYC
jgi:hypothetical protein